MVTTSTTTLAARMRIRDVFVRPRSRTVLLTLLLVACGSSGTSKDPLPNDSLINGASASTGSAQNAPVLTNQTAELTKEEALLIARMKSATIPEIKAFVRTTIDTPLPPDHVVPDYIQQAPTFQVASKEVGARFPEFYMKNGPEYLQAVAEHPVRFRELIEDTKGARLAFKDHPSVNVNSNPR